MIEKIIHFLLDRRLRKLCIEHDCFRIKLEFYMTTFDDEKSYVRYKVIGSTNEPHYHSHADGETLKEAVSEMIEKKDKWRASHD